MAKKKTIKYLENGEYHDATVKDVGVIEELKTENKDNLVEAINEIFLGGGKGFSDLQQKVDESTQAAQNAQQATDNLQQAANNLQQRLDEIVKNVGLSDEEAQKIINQAVEDAKRAQAEALQAYKEAQKELDDSMAQFMEEQKTINKELEQAKADIQDDIDQKNNEIEQINTVIESTKSDLTATSARLASVRNDLTNAQMDWGKVRTEITNINGKLDSKMSNTDFDEYKERIERNETEITQTKNELQSKATKQDLDVLTGTVTTQGSSITQLAGKIEQKVSKDTLANDIDDFQVKKANIFTGTREFMGWEFSDKALGRVNDDIYNHAKVAELHNGSNLSITVNGLEVGKTYSVSIFAKASANSNTSGVKVTVDNGKSYSGLMRTVYTPHDTKVTTNWQRYYATIVASATTMKFVFDRSGMTSDTTLYLNRPKLEVGETVYAWEDNAQDIYKRVEHTEAQFDVYNDQISGIVQRQTETDKKIENVSSTFTQRADGIEANSKKYTDDKTTGLAEEFSGKLRATSQELSAEYEKQTNAKIGALSDGGSNLILNSSFLVTDNNGNATLENWRDTSSKVSLTKPNGLDGTWIKVNRAATGTALGARSNYFPVKQGKLVVGVDVALDGTGNISPYVLRIEYYDVSNNRVNYEDITLQKLGLSASQITKSGSNFRYARGVYKTSNDRSDVAKACIVVPETVTGYDMYLTNFFAKFSDVNDGTYEVNPLDQQASLIKQRTKIEQDSEKINLLNTQTEKLGNDIKATNTSVNVLKGEVDLKASQSTVNDLTNRVAKNAADIKVFPDKIKSEVREVSKKVDGVNDKVDNMRVGGTNLVRNSAHNPISLEHWTTNNVGNIWYATHSFFRNSTTKMFFLDNKSNQEMLIQTEYIDIEPDTDYTLSMIVFGASGVSSGDVYYNIKYADGSNTYFNVDRAFKYNPYHAERKVYKFHTSPNSSGSKATQVFIRVDNNGLIPGYSDATCMLGDVKLEKGNVATDWSPAPEDTDGVIEEIKSVATQTKDGFERLTQKTGYNASTGEFAKVTTQINEGINGVSSEVRSVSNRLNNLSVGGTNLLKGTSRDLQQKSTTNDWVRLPYNTDFFRSIYPLDNFTARVWIEKPNKDSWLQAYVGGNGLFKGNVIKAGQSGYSEVHGTLNKDITGANLVIGAGDGVSVSLGYKELKLEKGTIATDWSPAPEDVQEGINIATTKATQTDTKFERMLSQIQYNDSTGEIGKYEHKITELANGTQEKISAITKRGSNMIIKSNFDDGNDLGGWYVASIYGSDFYRTTTTPKPDEMSSNYCLASGTRDALEANNIFPVVSGTKYYVSAWVYTSRKYAGKVGLYVKNSNNNNATHLGVTVPKDNQNRWIKIKGTITIPNGYNIAQPWLQVEKMVSDNEKIYFADISITRADDNAIELSETMTTRIGDLEKTIRTNTTNIGQYRQEMTNSAKEWSTKFTSVQNNLTGVSNRLDNLSVGGTNLVQNSSNPKNTDGWSTNGSHAILMATKHPYWKNNQENLFLLINKSTNGSEATFGSDYIKVDRNTDYTLSYWAFEDSYVPNSDTYFLGRKNGETSNFAIIKQLVRERKYSGGHAEYVSVTFNTGDIDEGYIRFDNNGNSGGNQSGLYIANIKLEKGNVATDWSPAPEDMENKIEVLSGKITANSNEFSTVYSKITNAKNDAINTIKGDSQWQSMGKIVTNASFLQNANGFAQEVSKTTTPMVNGGGKNLARGTSDSWTGVSTQEFNGSTNFTKHVADVYLDDLNVGDKVTVQIAYQYSGVTSNNAYCCLQGEGNVTSWNSGAFYASSIINMQTGTDVKHGSAKYTFDITADMKKNRYWSVAWRFDNVNKGAWFQWLKFKVERGSVATPWIPAPEDLATKLQLNDISSRTQFLQDDEKFLLRITQAGGATQADVNSANSKIGILQGQITATANKFNTVYTKTDVDNKINPLNSRTEFLQDNSKFLLRVQQAGAATGGVNNLLTNGDTFSGYSENNTNNFDFQKIEGSGLPAVPNQPSITMMGHVWNNYGSAYNKNDGIYLENGETYWFGVYLMTDNTSGAFRSLSIYATTDKNSNSGSATKSFFSESVDYNKHFGGKTKTWKWNTFKITGDGTTRYNWRIEPFNHVGGSIWTAGYMLVKSPFPPTGWSPNMTDVQMRLDSGGVTINGNTRINGILNANGMILDDKTGSKLEFTPNGLDISYSQNRNQYFTFSGSGLDFWKYTEAEGVEDFPYHHKPGYARLGNLTAWDGSYNDRTNYTARKHLDHPTNYNGMGFVIDVTGGSDEFSIWQEGTAYRSDSGAVGVGEYWSLFNVNATGFGAGRGRGIHHYTSNYFWSDQRDYNWQDDATLLGTIHDNGWKEFEIKSYRSAMAVKSEPHNSNAWVNGFIFGSQDGGDRIFGFDGSQWIDVVNKRTTRDNADYKNHFASMHLWEVQAHAFTTTSQLSQKIDIEPLNTKDFMSKLLSIDLYKYRYKTQSSEEKDNYGAIIDDVNKVKKYNLPQEFITTRDKGVNTNNLITGLIATAQEQAKQIEDLTFRILELERRNING